MGCFLHFFQSDPYWTVNTLTPKDRSRIGNLTVCSLVEMLRLTARANSSALLRIRKPPPDHPRFRSWFMDTLWALQKAGISQKRVSPAQCFTDKYYDQFYVCIGTGPIKFNFCASYLSCSDKTRLFLSYIQCIWSVFI